MRRIIGIILFIVISFTLTSCYEENSSIQQNETIVSKNIDEKSGDVTDNGPVSGGIVRIFSTKPDTMNPILSQNSYVQDFSTLIFEGLFKLGKDQTIIPVLCDKWDVSADGMIWTFHIRENVRWHNDTPLTAEDIKFTFDTILNAKVNSIYKINLENVAVYTVVDRNYFRVSLKKPNSFTKESMTFPIISQKYFSGEDITIPGSTKNIDPMGTGPFKLTTSNDPNTITLSSNTEWWNKNSGSEIKEELPYISGVEIKVYPKSSDAINAFQTRDVDVIFLPTSDFSKYNGRSDLVLRRYISKNFEYLAFNLSNSILAQNPVRQAIAYAIDKAKLINDAIPGQAVASDLPIIPDSWLNNTNINSVSPDKVKAKEILLSDGWKDQNGILYKRINGVYRPLKLSILINDFNEDRYKVANKICEQLKEIGIDATVTKLEWTQEMKAINSKKFDIALMGYKITSVPDISFAFSSTMNLTGQNTSGYNNPMVDSYLEQIMNENDPEKKKALMIGMKSIIQSDMPCIGLFFYNNAAIFSKNIRGDMNPIIWDKYNDITKWYMPTKNN